MARTSRKSGYVSEVNRRSELGKLMVDFGVHGQGDRQSDVGPFPGLWLHQADRRPGTAQSADASRTARLPGQGVPQEQLQPERTDALDHAQRSLCACRAALRPSNKADDPLLGETPKFSHFYLRQMRAEELYESLLVATEAHKTRGSYEEQEKSKGDWLRQFMIAFGTDEGDEATTFNGTIPQALMMFNGDLIKKATSIGEGELPVGRSRRTSRLKPADKINYLFLVGLGARAQQVGIGYRQQAAGRSPGRHGGGAAGHLVGRAEQQRVHFESLDRSIDLTSALRSVHELAARPFSRRCRMFTTLPLA